jgi:hypothetical protein
MQTQKSAVPAATGHDANHESLNSNPNLATPIAKSKRAAQPRKVYPMYPPIKRSRVAPMSEPDALRLLVWHLVQCVSQQRPSGFYVFEGYGPNTALVRWVEGFRDEKVCQVQFDRQRVLFLREVADAHELLQEAFTLGDFEVFIVDGFIAATCPACAGAGGVYHEAKFPSSHHVGVLPCETCDGEGVLNG